MPAGSEHLIYGWGWLICQPVILFIFRETPVLSGVLRSEGYTHFTEAQAVRCELVGLQLALKVQLNLK